ncbi:MAG: glycine cleavage system aminomethyltransferase GcvT [Thiobacillaceae bacterium]|nr:glycine cleavage system aminomethyltransferase GcvT [Thiobacillaceae bacterium]
MQHTPLNAQHRALKARLVDFAGWEMPLNYGSQIEEHHAVRRAAGMFDVSHMLIVDLRGEAVRPFLRRLLANDVAKLQTTGRALYGCMLHEGGGVIDDLIVYFLHEDWFRLVVNAGCAERDLAWIETQRDALAPGVQIRPRRDLAMIAVQGPQAGPKLWQAMPGTQALTQPLKPFAAVTVGDMFIARTGYTGEDGFEVMLPARAAPYFWQALLEAGVQPCGLGARDTLRLEAGLNLMGQDMDERVTPYESGLAWTVDLTDPARDFIGREALLRLPRSRQLTGLILLDRGVLRTKQKVHTAHGEGEVTSGGFSPTLAASIALARLPAQVAAGDEVEVEVRQQRLKARVVKPPFVRHGQPLVQVHTLPST